MTIGRCLEEIKKIYLDNSFERMSRVAMKLIREVKSHYYEGDYPKSGWFLFISNEGPYLANGENQIMIDLNPIPKIIKPPEDSNDYPSEVDDHHMYQNKIILFENSIIE